MDLDLIARPFVADPRILALYLLGSAATDRLRPDSDVDLAVLVEPGQVLGALERSRLANEASYSLKRDVDLGEVSSRNLVFAREAILTGKRLFARDAFRAETIETTLLGLYASFNEDRKELLDAYRTR